MKNKLILILEIFIVFLPVILIGFFVTAGFMRFYPDVEMSWLLFMLAIFGFAYALTVSYDMYRDAMNNHYIRTGQTKRYRHR